MSTVTRVRLEDFLVMPGIEERRLELIDGEIVEKPMPTWSHGRIALRLGSGLDEVGYASVEARAIFRASSTLDATAPLPDVAFYRSDPPEDGKWMTTPPHVAIEVLSPGQSRRDIRSKIEAYIALGVESVWIVDPQTQTVDIHEGGSRLTLSAPEDVLQSSAAPGFRMALSEVFRR